MLDYLEVYNKADVVPFVEAIEKERSRYYKDGIDLLKDAVSISGISMNYVINESLKNMDIKLFAPGGVCSLHDTKIKCKCDKTKPYKMLKTGMIGGPSIIFCTYAEKNVSKINSHIFKIRKTCKKIIGFDANSLYLWASGQNMPCGKEK